MDSTINKYRLVFFVMISLLIVALSCRKSENAHKEESPLIAELSSFELPVFSGGEKFKEYSLGSGYLHGVSYKVQKPYPDLEVLRYYEKELSQIGMKPFVEKYYRCGDRSWQYFDDLTKEGNPFVAQLSASWADDKHSKRANLTLRYYWYGIDLSSKSVLAENADMSVDFQIAPFYVSPPPHE